MKVFMKGIISQMPYAAYDLDGKILGYADDHMGPIVLDTTMKTLKDPIAVEVIELDESAWD